MVKNLYVSLEIQENGLQAVVSEYYNTRFLIISKQMIFSKGLRNYQIVDHTVLVNDIKTIFNLISENIKVKVEKTILVIPPYNFKKFNLKANITTENGILTKNDISRGLSNAYNSFKDAFYIVANASIKNYIVNNISHKQFPVNEPCKTCVLDIDLLCMEKKLCYEYVNVVTEAKVEVVDIVLTNYATCKEAQLFEQSFDKNILLLDMNLNTSFLTFISNGSIQHTILLDYAMNRFLKPCMEKYQIKFSNMIKIIKYHLQTDNQLLYSYKNDSETIKIYKDELIELLKPNIDNICNDINTLCKDILSNKKTTLIVTGQVADMKYFIDSLKQCINTEVINYYPNVMGIRGSQYTSIYGSLYVRKQIQDIKQEMTTYVDLNKYNQEIDIIKENQKHDLLSITKNLKELINFNNK